VIRGFESEFKVYLANRIIRSNSIAFFFAITNPISKQKILPFLHQADLLLHLMTVRPIRVLIADEIGLGKTIEALAIAKYLELQDGIRKVLILTPKILIEQWVSEVKRVGGMPRIVSSGSRLKNTFFKSGVDKAYYYIMSIDLAKRYPDIIDFVGWDLIIVDEAHNATLGTQRDYLLRKLTNNKRRNIILLSATPHRGDYKDYLNRLRYLDPTLTENYDALDAPKFYRVTHETLVFRRTKGIVNQTEREEIFKKCHVHSFIVDISDVEREYFSELQKILTEMITPDNAPLSLLAVILRKRASSSYYASIQTLNRMISRSKGKEHPKKVEDILQRIFALGYDELEIEADEIDEELDKIVEAYADILPSRQIERLRGILELARKAQEKDSKIKNVAKLVKYHLDREEKIVIFTEYLDTLEYLKNNLPKYLGINETDIVTISGKNKGDVHNIKERFEQENGAKILIATDVAGEGLNLQVANVLINYEAPWSPIKLEQRMGRIWRLGQKKESYVYTVFLSNKMDRDVLENLYRKLMNIDKAMTNPPQLVGSKVYIASTENLWRADLGLLNLDPKKRKKINEYTLVLESIKGNLGIYVRELLAMINQLSARLRAKSVFPVIKGEKIRSELSKYLGLDHLSRKQVEKELQEWLSLFLYGGDKKAINLWKELNALLLKGNTDIRSKMVLFVNGEGTLRRIYLVKLKNSSQTLIEIPVAIDNEGDILYGLKLLKALKDVSTQILAAVPYESVEETNQTSIEKFRDIGKIKSTIRKLLQEMSFKWEKYEERFHKPLKTGQVFFPLDFDKATVEEIAIFKYIREVESGEEKWERNSPTEEILKIEKEAMRIVIEYEKQRYIGKYGNDPSKWLVRDVSLEEHYDILSKDLVTDEVRYIEVKGHNGFSLWAELTEAEHKFAEDHAPNYWLYLVVNIGKEPMLFRFRNPLETLDIKTKKRYMLYVG